MSVSLANPRQNERDWRPMTVRHGRQTQWEGKVTVYRFGFYDGGGPSEGVKEITRPGGKRRVMS